MPEILQGPATLQYKHCAEKEPTLFLIYFPVCDPYQLNTDYGVKKLRAKAHFTYFDFWGFKYHLICKIGLKLSTFFDFILSWS